MVELYIKIVTISKSQGEKDVFDDLTLNEIYRCLCPISTNRFKKPDIIRCEKTSKFSTNHTLLITFELDTSAIDRTGLICAKDDIKSLCYKRLGKLFTYNDYYSVEILVRDQISNKYL